jgi:hypothetical protein
MNDSTSFRPIWWLKSGHVQTCMAALTPRPILETRDEWINLPDGDVLELHWVEAEKPDAPILLLLHGLEGSVRSPYIQGMLQLAQRNKWRAVVMHFRGSTGHINRTPQCYHAGRTEDLTSVLTHIRACHPKSSQMVAVGYSLGSNLLLKFLGENPNQSWLNAAVAVSVPFDLEATTRSLSSGMAQIYQKRFMKSLKRTIGYKLHFSMDMPVTLYELEQIKTMYEFDERVTAPLHGFKNAKDYYDNCSSQHFLEHIQTPTLIIHAEDDPIIPKWVIPKMKHKNKAISWDIQRHGGHVGFINGKHPKQLSYWLEERIPKYLSNYMESQED